MKAESPHRPAGAIRHDLHLHTRHSSDAEGSVLDADRKAKAAGIEIIAVTNHFPELPGHLWYASADGLRTLRDECKAAEDETGVTVLLGIEVTPLDYHGRTGLGSILREEFDWIVGGVHYSLHLQHMGSNRRPIPDKHSAHFGIPDYFEQTMGLIEKGEMDLLAHPLRGLSYCFEGDTYEERREKAVAFFPDVYREEIASACAANRIALEINEDSRLCDDRMLHYALEFGTPLAAASDAHRTDKVGEFEWVEDTVGRLGLQHLLLSPQEILSRIPSRAS